MEFTAQSADVDKLCRRMFWRGLLFDPDLSEASVLVGRTGPVLCFGC